MLGAPLEAERVKRKVERLPSISRCLNIFSAEVLLFLRNGQRSICLQQ